MVLSFKNGADMDQSAWILQIPAPENGSQISAAEAPISEEVVSDLVDGNLRIAGVFDVKLIFFQMISGPLEVALRAERALQIDGEIHHIFFPVPGVLPQHLGRGLNCPARRQQHYQKKGREKGREKGRARGWVVDSDQSGPLSPRING